MLKNISNLGSILSKTEQKNIKGGIQNDQETPPAGYSLRFDPELGGCIYTTNEELMECD